MKIINGGAMIQAVSYQDVLSQKVNSDRSNAYGTSKDQILRSAEYLFALQGFQNTTLKDVAARSRANTALVGYHFGNKEGLYRAVVEKQEEIVKHLLTELIHLSETNKDFRVQNVVDMFILFFNQEQTLFRIYQWSLLEGGTNADIFIQKMIQPILDSLNVLLAEIKPNLSSREREIKALFIWGTLCQYAHYRWFVFEKAHPHESEGFSLDDYHQSIKDRILQDF